MAEIQPLPEDSSQDQPPEGETSPPQSPAPADIPAVQPEATSLSLLRLLVGGVLEGSEKFYLRLRQWESASRAELTDEFAGQPSAPGGSPSAGPTATLRYALLGAMFTASRSAQRRLKRVSRLAEAANQAGLSLLKPITSHPLLRPLSQRLDRLAARGEEEVNRWVRLGQSEEMHSRSMVHRSLDETVSELPDTPQVDALVQALANKVIAYLEANPDVLLGLVRTQGDRFVDYLSENPTQVQTILQGQSTTLADEMSDEVRERMVTADNIFEMFVRSLLRRPLREELPKPPPEIRKRALRARLDSDFRPKNQ